MKTICKLLKNTNKIWKRRFYLHKTRTVWVGDRKMQSHELSRRIPLQFWSTFATMEPGTGQCAYKPGHGVLRIRISIRGAVLVKQRRLRIRRKTKGTGYAAGYGASRIWSRIRGIAHKELSVRGIALRTIFKKHESGHWEYEKGYGHCALDEAYEALHRWKDMRHCTHE